MVFRRCTPSVISLRIAPRLSRDFHIKSLVVEMNAGDDLDSDDRRDRPINRKTERRPPARVGNELSAVLPEVFEAVAGETDDEQPRCVCDRRGGDDDEHAGDTGFDGEDCSASVGDCETDVDRGDQREPERVDGCGIEPPERKRCGRLRDTDGESPHNRCSQPRADRLCKSRDAHGRVGAMRRSDRMAGCRARTWSRLLPFLTPRAGPAKAAIVSSVIAVMSWTEIEPTVAPPTRRRPSPVR